jgi:hypothetical protein
MTKSVSKFSSPQGLNDECDEAEDDDEVVEQFKDRLRAEQYCSHEKTEEGDGESDGDFAAGSAEEA